MKKLLPSIILLFMFFSATCFGQENKTDSESLYVKDDSVYTKVEVMACWKGCETKNNHTMRESCTHEKLQQYIMKNIKYPAVARERRISGKVVCGFIINTQGKITDVKVVKSVGGGCDEEVLRLIYAMPDWIPGTQNGKLVNVYYTLPVSFTLK